MNNNYGSLYSNARLYDLVVGSYAAGGFLDFYRRQIARYGDPVLELACGSGRLTIPLAEGGIIIKGLDISEEMLDLAQFKASERGVNIAFVRGDICNFDLDEKFNVICIPAHSLSHLHKRDEIESCFACIRRHLAKDGRFIVELFNPSLMLLTREPGRRYPVSVAQNEDPTGGRRVLVTEDVRYDSATQINHIRWFYRNEESDTETVLTFEMRVFFPQEIDALLAYNGFQIEQKYGSYDEQGFSSDTFEQLIVCHT